MKIYALLFLFIFPCAISCNHPEDEIMPKPDLIINAVTVQTARILEQRHDLHCCGSGRMGDKNGKLKTLEICFQLFDEKIDKTKARSMIIDCVNEFIVNINKNDEINEYLSNFPVTIENVSLSIFMLTKNSKTVYEPNLCGVAIDEGTIKYYTNEKGNYKSFKSIVTETFEEAEAIVNGTPQ